MKSKDKTQRASAAQAREAYANVVKSAELRDIKLLASSFVVETALFEYEEGEAVSDESLALTYGCEPPNVSYEPTDGGLLGQFEWRANAIRDGTEVLTISGTYVIAYRCGQGLDEKATARFVERVGRFATFPYFRALVGYYSTASSIEIPILPVLKE